MLTAQQMRAVSLAAEGKDQLAIAKETGRSVRTIQRWYANPEFRREVTELITGSVSAADEDMALATIRELAAVGKQAVRLRAAMALLELAVARRQLEGEEEAAPGRVKVIEVVKQVSVDPWRRKDYRPDAGGGNGHEEVNADGDSEGVDDPEAGDSEDVS